MSKNRFKEQNLGIPIENHQTAAWANIKKVKRVSRVPIPSLENVEYAKEYVEINKK